ncbi:unnamed protein product [Prunus armeniaca]|uniref:Uncharacterized protein n=1 Tax=Prunus armeniaca TaxID=36596 RepID=A0A6J5Y088_PRUAR|nr:unnamed protein product [Prunus armeniaca]
MMKVLRLLSSSRNQFPTRGALSMHAYTHSTSFSTASKSFSVKGTSAHNVFASFDIFKGKAALSLNPVLPTFTKLEFTPAIGERRYDWEKNQVFALSATEVGSLISLGSQGFFNAGQVRKSLSIKCHADGSGYLVSLTVVNNLLKTKENFVVPVTAAEFAVMKTACSFALPHIMGWDRLMGNMPSGVGGQRSNVGGQQSKVVPQLLDEWDR